MQANTTTTVQYDDHTWNVEAGPNGVGYYRLSRTDTYQHTIHVHGSELKFQPESDQVLAVVSALYGVYLTQTGDAGKAEIATENALGVLGWRTVRAYRAASHVASTYR